MHVGDHGRGITAGCRRLRGGGHRCTVPLGGRVILAQGCGRLRISRLRQPQRRLLQTRPLACRCVRASPPPPRACMAQAYAVGVPAMHGGTRCWSCCDAGGGAAHNVRVARTASAVRHCKYAWAVAPLVGKPLPQAAPSTICPEPPRCLGAGSSRRLAAPRSRLHLGLHGVANGGCLQGVGRCMA